MDSAMKSKVFSSDNSDDIDKLREDPTNNVISSENAEDEINTKKRVPRRILHFSDGTLEEYSSDESDDTDEIIKKKTVNELNAVDPKMMKWGPWFWYKTATGSTKALAVCDYLGEKLANFFGITSPKYEYEIDFCQTMKQEEEEKKKQQDLEMGGWVNAETNSLQTNVPESNLKNNN